MKYIKNNLLIEKVKVQDIEKKSCQYRYKTKP